MGCETGGASAPSVNPCFLTAQAVSRAHVRVPVISLGRYVTRFQARYDIGMRDTEFRHNPIHDLLYLRSVRPRRGGRVWLPVSGRCPETSGRPPGKVGRLGSRAANGSAAVRSPSATELAGLLINSGGPSPPAFSLLSQDD